MKPGSLPKPVELRKRDGTWRADRHPVPVATPLLNELPDPPEELDDEGQRVWVTVGNGMVDAGMPEKAIFRCWWSFRPRPAGTGGVSGDEEGGHGRSRL
jgi:hypothetical protein